MEYLSTKILGHSPTGSELVLLQLWKAYEPWRLVLVWICLICIGSSVVEQPKDCCLEDRQCEQDKMYLVKKQPSLVLG